jgi:hypothetical protein
VGLQRETTVSPQLALGTETVWRLQLRDQLLAGTGIGDLPPILQPELMRDGLLAVCGAL